MDSKQNINAFYRIVLLALAIGSCSRKEDPREVYEQIETGAVNNDKARIYEIDTLQSGISWTYELENGQAIRGKLFPALGSLILENDMITAGFFVADVLEAIPAKETKPAVLNMMKKMLADSIPILQSRGRLIRLDISQAGRQVSKSDFNVGQSIPDSLNTYVLGANLEIADSTRIVSLPVFLKMTPKQVRIKGVYDLNPGEFGMKKLAPSKKSGLTIPQVRVEYTLIFRPLK